TLTFINNAGVRGITTAINVNSPTLAQDIQDALNAPTMASIGGYSVPMQGSGHAIVTQSAINPLVFDIAIAGVLLPPSAPQPQGAPTPPNLMTARGTGIPDPVVTAASTWVNLTATATTPRLTLVGQTNPPAPPGTPGPNDDFRVSFPQGGADWSD